uniref:Uncharacterized protein n=1 Tax=Equus caballus TaxID=9796 RepID=A0A9L0SRP6_HORSE
MELPYDPAISLLGIYPQETKMLTQKEICFSMFTAAFFKIAKTWKQPQCPSMDEWIKKLWYISTVKCVLAIKTRGNPAICKNTDGP